MSSTVRHSINKENPNELIQSGKSMLINENNRSIGLKQMNNGGAKNENLTISKSGNSLTPSLRVSNLEQVSDTITSSISNTKDLVKNRRALGDVMNVTRHSQQSLSMIGTTPKLLNNMIKTPLACKTASNFTSNKLDKRLFSESKTNFKSERLNEQELPPVEKFISPPCDTFKDLFDGEEKLSDLFFNKNVTFVPQLPSGKQINPNSYENLNKLDLLDQTEWQKNTKKLKKSIKKQINQQEELIPHEMPNIDDLIFKIPVCF